MRIEWKDDDICRSLAVPSARPPCQRHGLFSTCFSVGAFSTPTILNRFFETSPLINEATTQNRFSCSADCPLASGSGRRSKRSLEGLAIHTAQPCASIPPGSRRVAHDATEIVVGGTGSADDIPKGRRREGVEQSIQKAGRKSVVGVDAGYEAGVEGRYRARPANRHRLRPVDNLEVTAVFAGVPSDVRHPAAGFSAAIADRHLDARLVGWDGRIKPITLATKRSFRWPQLKVCAGSVSGALVLAGLNLLATKSRNENHLISVAYFIISCRSCSINARCNHNHCMRMA